MGLYLTRIVAPLTDRFARTRVFRSTTPTLEIALHGEDLETAQWEFNIAPKTTPPKWIVPGSGNLHAVNPDGVYVFRDILNRPLADLGPQDSISLTTAMRRLVSLDLPEYG